MTTSTASTTLTGCWGSAEKLAPPSDGSGRDGDRWMVEVRPTRSGQIRRTVTVTRGGPVRDTTCGGHCGAWREDEVIWPAWCPPPVPENGAGMATVTALERVHEHWSRAADRIRETAKWMATVIGLALAALIGTSPFADLSARQPDLWFWVAAVAGLACLAVTLLLLTQVLLPHITSYDAIQTAEPGPGAQGRPTIWRSSRVDPLRTWKHQVENQQDLWLPSGVRCLVTLREAMIVDELTLLALSDAESAAAQIGQDEQAHVQLAQQIRVSRLRAWRAAASRIVLIGELYRLQARARRAIHLGIPLGVVGALSIVVAFAQLAPLPGR